MNRKKTTMQTNGESLVRETFYCSPKQREKFRKSADKRGWSYSKYYVTMLER